MDHSGVTPGLAGDYLPLTPLQERVWLLAKLAETAVPELSLRVIIQGTLDLNSLRNALRWVEGRHPILRTRIAREPVRHAVVQRTATEGTVLDVRDLNQAPASLPEDPAALAGPDQPLTGGPLVRYELVRQDVERHELTVAMHALVADRYSAGLFTNELIDAYQAFSAGKQPEQRDPVPQFVDHARLQCAPAGATRQIEQLEYWRRMLVGLPDPLELPFARSRASRPQLRCDALAFEIPAAVADATRELAADECTTPVVALTTALVVLLHRCTGRDDIMLGTPASGRTRPGTARVIGPLHDVLPVRVRLTADPTWRHTLRLVREALREADEHQDVPFSQILAQSGAERRVTAHPLFEILVGQMRPLRRVCQVGGTTFFVDEPVIRFSPFDLELFLEEPAVGMTGDPLRGVLRYNTGLYAAREVGRLLRYLLGQLDQLISVPDARLSNLSLLDSGEYRMIVHDWNSTTTSYPRDQCVHTLVAEQAARTPQAPALLWEDTSVTYGELDARANRLAHYLRELGVRPETRVGLFFGYTPAWVIAALATLKAGGAFVPLDPIYPPERLAAMCAASEVEVLLCDGQEAPIGFDRGPIVRVTVAGDEVADQPASAPGNLSAADHLAYVMFTSGSTGKPKSIGATHRNIVRTVVNTNYIEFRPTDRVAQASNISFDAVTLETWGALLSGALLVGLRKDQVMQPQMLKQLLEDNSIDIFFIPSALMKQIVSEAPDTFRSLRYFLSGGEQADYHTLRRLLDSGPPDNLVNPYGPTETTVFAITYRCNDLKDTERLVPIGYPISNTTAYVLDCYRQPVPAGVTGEIYVGGDGVARGYLGQPDQTADRFVADPFGSEPGARLYRTGDLGRFREDGAMEFLGRIDRQVKVRGFRIEPGDIEACILRSGLVSQAAVQVGKDTNGDDTIIAYLVPGEGAPGLDALRVWLRGQLPVYMLPSKLVVVPSLPLNVNGKLDQQALALLGEGGGLEGERSAEPSTATEGRLDALWREILDVEAFGIHDDFFKVGGTSLQVAWLAERAAGVFRMEIPLRLLFEHRTIFALAKAIDRLRAAPSPAAPAPAVDDGPDVRDGETAAAHAPETPTQGRLVEIWREVLDVPSISVADDFFQVGGHSIKGIKIVSRIKAELGIEVPLRLLFEHRTIAGLAYAIDAGMDLEAGIPGDRQSEPGSTLSSGVPGTESAADFSEEDILRLLEPGS